MPAITIPSYLTLATSAAPPDSHPEPRPPPHPPGITISRALLAALCIGTVIILLLRWRQRHNQRSPALQLPKTKTPALKPHLHKPQAHTSTPPSPPSQPSAFPPPPPPSTPHPSHPTAFPAPTLRRRSYPLTRPTPPTPRPQAGKPDPHEEASPPPRITKSHTTLSPANLNRHDTLLTTASYRRHVLVLGVVAIGAGVGMGNVR